MVKSYSLNIMRALLRHIVSSHKSVKGAEFCVVCFLFPTSWAISNNHACPTYTINCKNLKNAGHWCFFIHDQVVFLLVLFPNLQFPYGKQVVCSFVQAAAVTPRHRAPIGGEVQAGSWGLPRVNKVAWRLCALCLAIGMAASLQPSDKLCYFKDKAVEFEKHERKQRKAYVLSF